MFQRCVSPTLLRYNGENFAKFETQILIGETSVLWSRFAFCSFGRAFRIAESNQNAVKVGEVTSCWNVVAILFAKSAWILADAEWKWHGRHRRSRVWLINPTVNQYFNFHGPTPIAESELMNFDPYGCYKMYYLEANNSDARDNTIITN